MAVGEIEVAQQGVVQKALQNDVLVAGGAGIVDTAKTTGSARRQCRVGRDIPRVILERVRKEFIVLALAVCWAGKG